MNTDLLIFAANALSALTVAFCCVCRLAAKRFAKRSPLAWSYALLGSSALVVLFMALRGQMPAPGELSCNAGMAVYFAARSRTIRRLWRRYLQTA